MAARRFRLNTAQRLATSLQASGDPNMSWDVCSALVRVSQDRRRLRRRWLRQNPRVGKMICCGHIGISLLLTARRDSRPPIVPSSTAWCIAWRAAVVCRRCQQVDPHVSAAGFLTPSADWRGWREPGAMMMTHQLGLSGWRLLRRFLVLPYGSCDSAARRISWLPMSYIAAP